MPSYTRIVSISRRSTTSRTCIITCPMLRLLRRTSSPPPKPVSNEHLHSIGLRPSVFHKTKTLQPSVLLLIHSRHQRPSTEGSTRLCTAKISSHTQPPPQDVDDEATGPCFLDHHKMTDPAASHGGLTWLFIFHTTLVLLARTYPSPDCNTAPKQFRQRNL